MVKLLRFRHFCSASSIVPSSRSTCSGFVCTRSGFCTKPSSSKASNKRTNSLDGMYSMPAKCTSLGLTFLGSEKSPSKRSFGAKLPMGVSMRSPCCMWMTATSMKQLSMRVNSRGGRQRYLWAKSSSVCMEYVMPMAGRG